MIYSPLPNGAEPRPPRGSSAVQLVEKRIYHPTHAPEENTMKVNSDCYICAKPFEPGDAIALDGRSTRLGMHVKCVAPKRYVPPTYPLISLHVADEHIEAQASVIKHADGEVSDLRDCLQMFVGTCPHCKGKGVLEEVDKTPTADGFVAQAEICEPCATAISLLEKTQPVDA